MSLKNVPLLLFPSYTSHLCSFLSGKEPQSQPSVLVWLIGPAGLCGAHEAAGLVEAHDGLPS